MPTEFFVNTDAIIAGSNRIGHMSTNLIARSARELAHEALSNVFEAACVFADSDGGFPIEFQEHLMRVVSTLDVNVIASPGEVFVSVDFDDLGTREDLERAFHQGARLENGNKLWGPYEGQALAQDDAEERHLFWEALREGRSYATITLKSGRRKEIPIRDSAGKWEETKQQYINIWGNKAPEWLFIQFGQEEWDPYVPQWDIIADFYSTYHTLLETALTSMVEYEVAIANSYESLGVETGFTSKGQPRLTSGAATINGKSYRTGQFIPKKPA